MKNFPTFAAVLCLGSLVFLVPAAPSAEPDFTLLDKLVARETAAKKTAHEGWDTGVTAKMLAATSAYNDTLTAMLNELVAAYYTKAKVTKEEVAAYAKTLKTAAEFRHKLDNPAAEDRGTLDALEAPSVVSSDLEDTIEQVVQAVTQDNEKFDYTAWEKRWTEAKGTGDVDVAATPPAANAPAENKPSPAEVTKPAKSEKAE